MVPTLLAPSFRHDRAGHWLAECGGVDPEPALTADARADVVIVGGGYAGLWTAWALTEQDPDARVVVIEAATCGAGPSGRNAGFVNGFWQRLDLLCELFGDRAAVEICALAAASVDAIGAWARSQEIEIGFRKRGQMKVSTSPAQDDAWMPAVLACARLGNAAQYTAIDGVQARRRCDSPLFRGGAWMPEAATVQPARLALGLRASLLARGVAIHEHTRATRIGPEPAPGSWSRPPPGRGFALVPRSSRSTPPRPPSGPCDRGSPSARPT